MMGIKRINLDNLPRQQIGNKISWRDSIGCQLEFQHGNICGNVKIVDYYKNKENNKEYVVIEYMGKLYDFITSMIKKCEIQKMFFDNELYYLYVVGDVLYTNNSSVKILERIYIKNKNGKSHRGYKCECLTCGYIFNTNEWMLNKGSGCAVCANNVVKITYNDMWTTAPNIAQLLLNPEDGYNHTKCSKFKVDWLCPNCGNIIKNKRISYVNKRGLICTFCGDGFSIPHKFIANMLNTLNIDFLTNQKCDWCKFTLKNGRDYQGIYDFYFGVNHKNYIIEADGFWHKHAHPKGKLTLEEIEFIDKEKDRLAKENDCVMIRIDSEPSEFEFIRDNILKSELNNIFDLSQIDFDDCYKRSLKSKMVEACDLWNEYYDIRIISNKLNISESITRKYIKKGSVVNLCDYDPIEERKKGYMKISKKVRCLNDGKEYSSVEEAARDKSIDRKSIDNSCRGIGYKSNRKRKLSYEWEYID